MMNEVRFSSYTVMGEPKLSVDLDTFIKLFVNHRPVYGIGKNNIEEAFRAILADQEDAAGGDAPERLPRGTVAAPAPQPARRPRHRGQIQLQGAD